MGEIEAVKWIRQAYFAEHAILHTCGLSKAPKDSPNVVLYSNRPLALLIPETMCSKLACGAKIRDSFEKAAFQSVAYGVFPG